MDPQTRHRIIGVVLLCVLAALVTPVIFRSPDQVRVALDMDLPPPPDVEPISLSPVVTDDEIEQADEAIDQAREDIAEAAYFFASDLSEKSTGNILNVDAGNKEAFTR